MPVKLRYRTLKSGVKSYYLDIHHNKERWREFLKIKIAPKDPKRKELLRFVEELKAQKEIELLSNDVDRIPDHIKKIRFENFAEGFIRDYNKADIRVIKSSVKQFKSFIKNTSLRMVDITEDVMYGYMDYLNTHPDLSV